MGRRNRNRILIEMKTRKINIPIFVSHRGCPNDCIFCNQKKITGESGKADFEEVYEKIKNSLNTAPENCEIEIAFFGGSFTGIDFYEQNSYLDTAGKFISDKRIKGIRLSTRPDYINEMILENLKKKGVTAIELGVQSMDDDVLIKNKRNLKSEDTIRASEMIKAYGFELGLQMMTGMYGSDREKDIKTAEEIISLEPKTVRIYPTVVIEDTELFKMYERGEYTPRSLEDTVDLCATLFDMFENAGITVIRAGLMSAENVREDKVIGPYHSSFGELVASLRYYRKLDKELGKTDICGKCAEILCERRIISQVAGNKRNNILKLTEKYKPKSLKVKESDIKGWRINVRDI